MTRIEDMVSEPVKVLKIEECSTRTEDRLTEPDRLLAKPLTSELVENNKPVKDRDSAI